MGIILNISFKELEGFGKNYFISLISSMRVFHLYRFVADVSQPGLVCRLDPALISNTTP